MEITPQQANKLKRAHSNITGVLKDLGIIEDASAKPVEPQWLKDTAKQWGLLNDLKMKHDGDVGLDEWRRLGMQHSYDPRGLGGFFVGSQPLMASHGVRRVLTEHGKRFIERWRGDFE